MHKMKLFGGVAVAAVVFALPAMAADTLKYGPAEAWVKPLDLPKPDDAYSGAPAQVLLQNLQVNFAANGDIDYYTEVAIHIQTAAGLQMAQSYITWNPDIDEATVNKVQILRGDPDHGGQVIDVLKNQTFTTLRREQNLDRAMLDGVLTGVLQPEGMQVGDTLVFGSSIRRHDPVLAGRGETLLDNLSEGAVVHQQVRVLWDPAHPIHWRQSDDMTGRIVKAAPGGSDSFILDRNHVTKPDTQADAPARFNRVGSLEFTQFNSWAEISTLMAPLYVKATALSADSALHKEVAAIKAATSDPKAQAAMALRLVENQVRYVFLGMNFGGYIPADADVTWQRRFGDCKGKSALLVAILHELGIKAAPAVVNPLDNDGIDQRLPALELFNHVIVRAEIGGKIYWLDGTRLGDRDLDGLTPPAVRWALPLTTEGATLEAVKMTPPDKPTQDTFLKLDASAGLDIPAQAHAERTMRGDDAVQFDMAYRAAPPTDREKGLKAYWNSAYDWITPRKVTATFDAATGEERLVMDGAADMAWTASDDKKTWRYETDIMSLGWGEAEKRDSGPHKDAPVVIDFPYFEKTREEIILPKGAKDFTLDGTTVDKTLGGAEFKRSFAVKDGVATLEASKRAAVPEISYADAVAQSPVLVEMGKKDVYLVAPKSYHKADPTQTKSDASTEAAADTPKTADEWVDEGRQLAQQNKMDEALADFNKALRADPTNIKALMARGIIFMMRGNTAAGAADLELVVKTDPTQWQALDGLGAMRLEQKRYDEAISDFTKALAIYPNDGFALQNRARAYLGTGEKDKARTDADAAHDLDADAPGVVSLRADIALAEDRTEDARTILRDAIAAHPDDMTLHARLADMLFDCVKLDADKCAASKAEAVGEYDKLIAAQPTAWAYSMRAQARPAAEHQQKLDDVTAAIKLDPKSTMPLLVRAAIYMNDKDHPKDYDKALPDINAALLLDPKDTEALGIRARYYFETKQLDLAMADIDAQKRVTPDQPFVYNTSCWERGTHNLQLESALADCDMAVKLAPKVGGYLDSRGLVKYRLGRLDDALADYNAALALEPAIAGSLYVRGLIKLKKGNKSGGKADIAAAQKIHPKIADEFAGYGVKP